MRTPSAVMHETEKEPEATVPARSQTRQFVALLVIGAATAQALGLTLNMKSQFGANDISRWCTVWSLLERGTYAIDDCPWESKTQDKVQKPDKLSPPGKEAGFLTRLEYRIAPARWKDGEPVQRLYSSKPPLLSTLIAGLIYPVRKLTGVELDQTVTEPRLPRWVDKPVEGEPGKVAHVREIPKEPVRWPAWSFYFKSIIIFFNILPMFVFLVFYARLLDRYALNDWAWFFCLVSAAWGTFAFTFAQTLNNHTIAASSAFFALYGLIRVWDEGVRSPWTFASMGFWGAFCACNELPAALFGLGLFTLVLVRFPRSTLLYFVPAAAVPCIAFLVTQFIALGQFKPVYEEFGTKTYNFQGSYWNDPLELDWFNVHPEPKGVYLFHITLGHHGLFSLTPIFVFSVIGALVIAFRRGGGLKPVAWLTLVLTAGMIAFWATTTKARNYGGSTQGLRWLLWLTPFLLIVLPPGVSGGQDRRWLRWLTLAALCVSLLSVGYGIRTPWSHPWLLDAMEHLKLYHLKR